MNTLTIARDESLLESQLGNVELEGKISTIAVSLSSAAFLANSVLNTVYMDSGPAIFYGVMAVVTGAVAVGAQRMGRSLYGN